MQRQDRSSYRCGRTTFEGRTFKLEFWDEDDYRSDQKYPYFRVSEVTTYTGKKYVFFGPPVEKEHETEIASGWTEEDRLEMAKGKIKKYTEREKVKEREREKIETFCSQEQLDFPRDIKNLVFPRSIKNLFFQRDRHKTNVYLVYDIGEQLVAKIILENGYLFCHCPSDSKLPLCSYRYGHDSFDADGPILTSCLTLIADRINQEISGRNSHEGYSD